jgi:hypothetical protein
MSFPRHERDLSVEDLHAMPDGGFTYTLQAGLLISEPRPGFRDGRVFATMTEMSATHVRRRRLGVGLDGDSAFVPARTR